jgi:hypothetical protein
LTNHKRKRSGIERAIRELSPRLVDRTILVLVSIMHDIDEHKKDEVDVVAGYIQLEVTLASTIGKARSTTFSCRSCA